MEIEQITECIFCGAATTEQHTTRIGLVFIHTSCLPDLQEIISLPGEELEVYVN